MVWILLLISIAFAAANNILLHKQGGFRQITDALFFNALVSCEWILLLALLMLIQGFSFTVGTVLWGCAYGLVIASFLVCKLQAMATGPVSLTSFIGCSSLLVSTVFGVAVLHEGATLLQWVGVLLLMTSLFFIAAPKYEKISTKWKIWCGLFLLFGAATGIIFKLHQKSAEAAHITEMIFCASVVSAVLLGVVTLVLVKCRKTDGQTKPSFFTKRTVGFLIACGFVSCCYNRLNIGLTGMLPSVVFFPVFNGSVILISTLSGVLFFKERMKPSQKIGFCIGIPALLLVSGTVDGILKLLAK